jgi:uncharacterized protein YraI
MQGKQVTIGLGALAGAMLLAVQALAVPAVYSPTGHLNVRSGPGFQYGVVAQMPANTRFPVTGCIADYSWCSVTVGNVSGWASGPYLVTEYGGKLTNLQESGAQLGVPIVVAPDTGAGFVATPPPVGAMVPVAPAVGVVAPIVPNPAWVSYVTTQAVEPVIVNGEVMVGAVLPTAVPVYTIPESPYAYAAVNGQRVLIEPGPRRIVYVF